MLWGILQTHKLFRIIYIRWLLHIRLHFLKSTIVIYDEQTVEMTSETVCRRLNGRFQALVLTRNYLN